MKTRVRNKNQSLLKTLFVAVLTVISIYCSGQTDPTDSLPGDPGGLTVYTMQNLSFGAFTDGATGGSVIISNSGIRSITGNVVPLNLGISYFQAIFEIDAPIGSIISILNGADATLTGSNGGSMSMHIGGSDPASPFITVVSQPARTQISIGGTLTVGNTASNPPGNYNGTFYITFNQE